MSKRREMVKILLILLCSFLLFCNSAIADISVLTMNGPGSSPFQPETFFSFYNGPGYNVARSDLLNPAYFGSGGIVNNPVNIITPVSSFNSSNLAGVDVVVLTPWMILTDGDKTALSTFVWNGGGLLAFGNSAEGALATTFGATYTSEIWDTSGGANINTSSPISKGPFGSIGGTEPIGLGASTSFESSLGPYGNAFLTSFANKVVGVSFNYGNGRAIIYTDEEIFLNVPPNDWVGPVALYSGQIQYQNLSNEKLFLNSFAYVIPSAVPEPVSLLLLGFGLLGLAGIRRKL